MNKQQSIDFIQRLFQELWLPRNADKLPEFYHKDLVAQIGHQTASYEDILNRLNYSKTNHEKLTIELEDILVDENKISVRTRQTVQDKKHGSSTYLAFFTYEMRDGKIAKLWSVFDNSFDYFEKA